MSRLSTSIKYLFGILGVLSTLGSVASAFTTDEKEQLNNLINCLEVCMPVVDNNRLATNGADESGYFDRTGPNPICDINDDYVKSIKTEEVSETKENNETEINALNDKKLEHVFQNSNNLNDGDRQEVEKRLVVIRERLEKLNDISDEEIKIYTQCEAYCTTNCIKTHIYNCDVIKKPFRTILNIPSNILQGDELLPDCDMEEFGKDFGYGVGSFVVGTATGALKGAASELPEFDLTWLWILLAVIAVALLVTAGVVAWRRSSQARQQS